jgi:hypothetical protein
VLALGEVHGHFALHIRGLDVHTKHVRVVLSPIGRPACRHNIAPPFELRRETRANVRLTFCVDTGIVLIG